MDIGADHGLFSLAAEKKVKKVYAGENKKGPYERLALRVKGSTVTPLFSDGIDVLPKDVNTLVILGMGGGTIFEILSKHPERLSQIHTLIIEPQSEVEAPVSYLYKMGFENVDGCYVLEKRYYPILKFIRHKTSLPSLRQLRYGPYPYQKKDPLLVASLKKELSRYQSLEESAKESKKEQIRELEECIQDETETSLD